MWKKVAAGGAIAAATMGNALAGATITTPDGTFDFGGFDWASTASVYIQGYGALAGQAIGTTDDFTLTYQAYAVNVQNGVGDNLSLPGLKVTDGGSGYEFTIQAVVQERVTCITANCTVVQIDVLSGSWDIWYQEIGNAVLSGANGGITGILDGTKILSGIFDNTSDSIIGAQGASNPGNVTLAGTFRGEVTYTNLAYINPELAGTLAVSTLQFGTNTTAWVRPDQFDGIGAVGADTNQNFVGQADANQSFVEQKVPEPGTLALGGLGLLLAAASRRRKQR